jgi:PAS domain S-box-containing protein
MDSDADRGSAHPPSRGRSRERAAFFRQYYEPVATNSRHSLAVVDAGSCLVLFANQRFLASHGLPPSQAFPFDCARVYGDGACRGEMRCPGAEACARDHEIRRRETRPADAGLPARTTEIIAIPLSRRSEFGREAEALVIEKEEDAERLGDAGTADEEDREHLASIARYSADAVIGLTLDNRIRSWNHGAEETFGYRTDEVIGRDFSFLVPHEPEQRREYANLLKEFERRGILKNYQARRIAKDGRGVIVNCTSSLLRDRAGNARGVSLICRDVTMEVLLRELIEHQMRAMSVTHEIGDLLHSTRSVDEILQLILIGVTAGQGLGFNRAFLLLVEPVEGDVRLRGRMAIGPSNPDEANRIWTALADAQLSLPELYNRYREQASSSDEQVRRTVGAFDVSLADETHVLARAIRERRAFNVEGGRIVGEGTFASPDVGLTLACDSFAIVPLNTRERAIGLLLVDNRITGIRISDADLQMLKVFANHAGIALENSQLRANLERRLFEVEQLNVALKQQQTQLMQAERLSVIGEMAARVAHEVRNPLVSIGGFARLVRRGLPENDPRSDYLRIISDEVARLERIVAELLDFSRPHSKLHLREVEIGVLVHELVKMATVEAESHGVRVSERYDPALDKVTIDPDKTKQVLLNILRNALDVSDEGGEIAIETRALDANRFSVVIRDTGPGIPDERKQKVFEPGFTTRSNGTGFGLAIVKRLVELQGGQVSLTDTIPHGCTFDVVLPQRVDLEEKVHAAEAHANPDRG